MSEISNNTSENITICNSTEQENNFENILSDQLLRFFSIFVAQTSTNLSD